MKRYTLAQTVIEYAVIDAEDIDDAWERVDAESEWQQQDISHTWIHEVEELPDSKHTNEEN